MSSRTLPDAQATVSKEYRGRSWTGVGSDYNSVIPDAILNCVSRCRSSHIALRVARLAALIIGLTTAAAAVDWNSSERELAQKLFADCGATPILLSFANRSSLGRRDSEIIENGIRNSFLATGGRIATTEKSGPTVTISLSENLTAYVWVAQIQSGDGEDRFEIVSLPRPAGATAANESVPLILRKISVWSQRDAILDVSVLEEGNAPTRIAVLSAEKISLYRWQGGKWQEEQALEISHRHWWPRDLRGRLMPGRDHLLDVYLPGVVCQTTAASPMTLNCRESGDPWPLLTVSGIGLVPPDASGVTNGEVSGTIRASFAASRNFFTGTMTLPGARVANVPEFYSAAVLQQGMSSLWLIAAKDGQVHVIDGAKDQAAPWNWGSDISAVKTRCGAGAQVFVTSRGEQAGDSVRAYEFPERDPVAVTAEVEFPGPISSLWTEPRGDTAIAVAKNLETGNYEAFRLAVDCAW